MSNNNRSGLMNSMLNALRPSNIIKKVLYMFVIISFLSIRDFIFYLNLAGQTGKAWWTAILPAYRSGLAVVFASIWTFIVDIGTLRFDNFSQNAWGNLIFGTIFLIGALYVIYQPVSLIIDALDGDKDDITSIFFKIMATLVVVVIISALVYYGTNTQSALTNIASNSTVMNQTINSTINNTIRSTGGNVINYIN